MSRDVDHLLARMRAGPTRQHALEILEYAAGFLDTLPRKERDRAYYDAERILDTLSDEDR